MNYQIKNIRPFIGSKDYELSKAFYRALGFEEIILSEQMCLFKVRENLSFYLQDYYERKWVDNSMVFLEVDDVDQCYKDLVLKALPQKFKGVKLSPIKDWDWGRECFLHDPAGVLWHFGQFSKRVKII